METAHTESPTLVLAAAQEDAFALDCALVPVRQLMTTSVATLKVDDSVRCAIDLFSSKPFRHVLVTAGRRVMGVVSDRDAMRALIRKRDPDGTRVSAIMTADPITVRPDAPVSEAIHLLLANRIHCLAVCEADQLLQGILTTSDLLRALFTIQRWLESRGLQVRS